MDNCPASTRSFFHCRTLKELDTVFQIEPCCVNRLSFSLRSWFIRASVSTNGPRRFMWNVFLWQAHFTQLPLAVRQSVRRPHTDMYFRARIRDAQQTPDQTITLRQANQSKQEWALLNTMGMPDTATEKWSLYSIRTTASFSKQLMRIKSASNSGFLEENCWFVDHPKWTMYNTYVAYVLGPFTKYTLFVFKNFYPSLKEIWFM